MSARKQGGRTRKAPPSQTSLFFDPSADGLIELNRQALLDRITHANANEGADGLRADIRLLKESITSPRRSDRLISHQPVDECVSLKKDVLLSELDQILDARTIERAKYYLKRLEKGLRSRSTGKINDINLLRWKEYDDILTDSLWSFPKRDASGAHIAWYWGNFVPQIPHQLILRYTKKGDWVLDPFAGSGTTLIECRRLGRNGIGVELNSEITEKARELIGLEQNRHSAISEIITGDSRANAAEQALAEHGVAKVQLVIMHPPYADIIRFSEDTSDLSNAGDVETFLEMFGETVERATALLEKDRYLAVVIGDKYEDGEWIPLGFYCLNEVMKRGYSLKSIVVKNFEETRAKRDQKQLWRYRALVGGFYIFKHEYILLFKKR
ncbi:MAG: DNA methyltransferase [Blastocatellia bacterium AA13]|nr:MAG: DNA methyltransferase [Blastocatellia bacterium AA13]